MSGSQKLDCISWVQRQVPVADQTSKAQQICCLLFLLKASSKAWSFLHVKTHNLTILQTFSFDPPTTEKSHKGHGRERIWARKKYDSATERCFLAMLEGCMLLLLIMYQQVRLNTWSTHAKVNMETANTLAGVGKCLFFPLNYYYNSYCTEYTGDVSRLNHPVLYVSIPIVWEISIPPRNLDADLQADRNSLGGPKVGLRRELTC